MQDWFRNAKLGIFIHYGIYAVDGVAESWSFHDGRVSYEDYMSQLPRFTASRYDPGEWAALFQRAGAKYAVLTSRHHDGVALWDSAFGSLNVGRDLLAPYADALRSQELKVGLYYSHSDWSHPDYVAPDADPVAWQRFLDYRDAQVGELVSKYRPDLLWFDGEWERTEPQWRLEPLARLIFAGNPETILNARMLSYGHYATPEQGVPMVAPDGPWELCLTINDSWGYQGSDTNYKSARQIIRYFAETIGAGGNLLLDVGPMEDGTIPAQQVSILESLGDWIRAHSVAVYGTGAGLPPGYHYGPSTLSADRRTLYLFCFDPPREVVAVRGLSSRVKSATVVGTGESLSCKVTGGMHEVPGVLWIGAPSTCDKYSTVIALELDAELALYRGTGRD